MLEAKKVTIHELLEGRDHQLGLSLLAGNDGLHRTLENPRVQKAGLALAGFLQSIRPHRLQVFGKTELQYLASLSEQRARASCKAFFCAEIAAVAVTSAQRVERSIREAAEACDVPLLLSEESSSRFIGKVQDYLDERLSPEETIHGVMMDVFGIGVLILGSAGIGKSECALDLVLRGQRLIADDAVRLVRRRRTIVASSVAITKHYMEIRGLGVINVMEMFGAAAVGDRKRVEMVVEMVDHSDLRDIDRLGLDEYTTQILDVELAKVTIPVRPGRSVSSIIEVAARNHLLKLQGHHAARTLNDRIQSHFEKLSS